MEKMTRMSKYKELRESLKNDVVTNEQTQTYVANEEIVKDASYYRNLVGENINNEIQVEIQQAHNNDTLYESLTFETITENEPEEVKSAIGRVKENSGLDHYNTRMDILNKIRQAKIETPTTVTLEEEVDEVEEPIVNLKEEIEAKVQETVNDSMFEDMEEDINQTEEVEENTHKKRFGLFKSKKVEEIEEEIVEEDEMEEETEEYEEEESSFMVKLLNGLIIVLSLVLVGLVLFIAKEFLF